MCIHHNSKKRNLTPLFYGIALILGILGGFGIVPFLETIGVLISEIFIKIFRCISLPIIALSIIVTMAQTHEDASIQGIWRRTLFYTLSTTLLAAGLTFLLYILFSPSNIHISTLGSVAETVSESTQHISYTSYLQQLIPSHILEPFITHHVMGALFVSIVIGIALRTIPNPTARDSLNNLFKGIHGLFMVITGWIVKMIPFALFGFITAAFVQLRTGGDIKGLGGYLSVVILANVIQGIVILPLLLYFYGIRPFKALKGMLPALSVAFFSKSSAGTLPVTMETIERNLGVSPRISRLVLPLCTSINMNGCAAFIFATVIYVMQNNGIEITVPLMMGWIVIATIAAIGNAGVPMGCFFLSASLLSSMNIPIALLGLILPFYSLIDMIETALNVWSDACVTAVIDKTET